MAKTSRAGEWCAWGVPLLIYVGVVVPLAVHLRDLLSPDAVAYIRRAVYVGRGLFSASVSGYWSPLISWTIAPVLSLKLDPAYAARVALALWGAGLVIATHAFMRAFTTWNWAWRLSVLSLVAVIAADRAARQVTPDVALATCLLAYFAAIWSPRFQTNRKWQLFTGALAGCAFLAKSYGLPFVALHLPATIIGHHLARTRDAPNARLMPTLATAVAGWLIVITPWIGVLSAHYGRFTTNTVGGVARAMLFPGQLTNEDAFQNRLRLFTPPPDPYVSQMENPDQTRYAVRSPFENAELMRRQLATIGRQAGSIARYIFDFSALGLGLLAIIAGILVAVIPTEFAGSNRWRAIWLLATAALFCSGFMLVYVESRYLDMVVLILLLVVLLCAVHSVNRARAGVRVILLAIVIGCFAWPLVAEFRELSHFQSAVIYRDVATLLHKHDLIGTTACTNRYAGMYLALLTGGKQQTIVAVSPAQYEQHAAMERALLAGHPTSIIVWRERHDKPEEKNAQAYAASLLKRLDWERKLRIKNKYGRSIEIYAPRADDRDPWTALPATLPTGLPATLPSTERAVG